MVQPFSMTLEGYAAIDREVKNGGNSGRIFVPKKWAGKMVRVILIEPIEE